MAEERRERLPPHVITNLYAIAWGFDIFRILLAGFMFAIGFALWIFGLVSVIGSLFFIPLGIGLQFMGALFSMIISTLAIGFIGWMYSSRNISLLDRGGALFWKKILFYFLSVIPFMPWTAISVWLVIRAVQKEDREYNRARGL